MTHVCFLTILTQPSEENAQAQRNIYAVMTGARLDDEEHDVAQELKRILQTMAPQGLFEDEPWHSTRLGPAPAAVAPVQDRTSNITFPDGSRIFQPADPVAQERSYRIPPPELNHPSQEYLTNTFPNSWNPEWKTRDEFEAFLQGRLETFLPGLDLSIVPWDKLNVHGLVFYYGSLIDKAIKDNEQTADFNTNVWLAELDKERELASNLLSRTEKAPLEDEASLLEAFGYKDAAQARNRLTTEVSFVFEAYGLQLPTDLNQWSLLELANAYHGLLTKVVQPSFHAVEGSEDHKKALAFIDGFEHQIPRSSGYVASRSEQYVIDRLEGRQEGDWGPAANLFLFVASIFIEPVDWIVTGVEMIDAASRGDWGQVVVNGVLAALPFVSGQVDNVARKALGASEDFAQAGLRNVSPNQITNITELNLTRGLQRAGSDYVMAADNYVSRTVSGYNSTNARRLNREVERAARVDDSFAWRLKTHSKQEMHHIVPVGRIEGDDARDIMSEKGVFVNSAQMGSP